MVNKSDLTIGKKIWGVSPACGIYDGMGIFEFEVKEFTDNCVNCGMPLSYCFLNEEDAKSFAKQEDEKAYAAFDDYYNEVKKCKKHLTEFINL